MAQPVGEKDDEGVDVPQVEGLHVKVPIADRDGVPELAPLMEGELVAEAHAERDGEPDGQGEADWEPEGVEDTLPLRQAVDDTDCEADTEGHAEEVLVAQPLDVTVQLPVPPVDTVGDEVEEGEEEAQSVADTVAVLHELADPHADNVKEGEAVPQGEGVADKVLLGHTDAVGEESKDADGAPLGEEVPVPQGLSVEE